MGEEGDLVAMRLARGCRCFAAWLGGELAAYGWLSAEREWIGELELEITPGRREAYIWNCVTLAAHRRKGVFRTLLQAIVAQGRIEGLSRLWIGSVRIPAERALGPSGFLAALRVNSTVISGVRWLKVMPADGADPNLVEAARKVLAVGGRPLRLGTSLRRSRPRRH
ncbi:GNAT family N-acetyltransferase [bacterium]|nr:MAG: GNAT family N-acetyltransferase [bacterium]